MSQVEGSARAKAWGKQPSLTGAQTVRWARRGVMPEPCKPHMAVETERAWWSVGQPDSGPAG